MRASRLRRLGPPSLASLFAAAALLARPPQAFCAEPGPAAREARKALHLVSYVASDYAGAVRDGKVADPAELDEQLALLGQAAASLEGAQAVTGGNHLHQELLALRERARALAPASELTPRLNRLADALSSLPGVLEPPAEGPSFERGKALFSQHCASCHGDDGQARTPMARELKPPPADLTDPRVVEWLSPARVAMTVEMGIPGTAMVPVELGNRERWDVAFYAVALAHSGEAAAGSEIPRYSLAELALGTDHSLREELLGAGVAVEQAEPPLVALRLRAPFAPSPPAGALPDARLALRRARSLLALGDEASAKREASAADRALAQASQAVSPTRPELARLLDARRASLTQPPTEASLRATLDAAVQGALGEPPAGSAWKRWTAGLAAVVSIIALAFVARARARGGSSEPGHGRDA